MLFIDYENEQAPITWNLHIPKKQNVKYTSPLVLITHYKQQAKNPNYSGMGLCVCWGWKRGTGIVGGGNDNKRRMDPCHLSNKNVISMDQYCSLNRNLLHPCPTNATVTVFTIISSPSPFLTAHPKLHREHY